MPKGCLPCVLQFTYSHGISVMALTLGLMREPYSGSLRRNHPICRIPRERGGIGGTKVTPSR